MIIITFLFGFEGRAVILGAEPNFRFHETDKSAKKNQTGKKVYSGNGNA